MKAEFEPQPPRGPGSRRRGGGAVTPAGVAPGAGGRTLVAGRTAAQREARLKLLNDALDVYRKAGATLHPSNSRETSPDRRHIGFVLSMEAAAAFDDLTRSKDINDPSLDTWPNTFRTHRFVPAVEYIRAQRARTLLMREMDKLMSQYDVFLSRRTAPRLADEPDRASGGRRRRSSTTADRADGDGTVDDEATILRVALAYERERTGTQRLRRCRSRGQGDSTYSRCRATIGSTRDARRAGR